MLLLCIYLLLQFSGGKFGIAPSVYLGMRRTPSSVCESDQYGMIFFFLYQSDHFTMEMGKQPIVFENPMYASGDSAVKVAQPTQVRSPTVLSFKCYYCWILFY